MLRSVIFGVSMAVIAVAVLGIIDKFTDLQPSYLHYGALAVTAAVVGWSVMILILFPDLKRLAKHLDTSLALGEKVQTMVEFRGQRSAMLAMQRADTDRVLRDTPKKRVKGSCTWLFAVLPAVAVLCMVGTILVPAKAPDAPPAVVDRTWHLTQWEEQSLKDLIREVQESGMEYVPKAATVMELQSLLDELYTVNKESVMKQAVVSTIADIHTLVKDHNTYDVLAEALALAPSELMGELADSMLTLDPLLVSETMQDMREALVADPAMATVMVTSLRQAIRIAGIPESNETVIALTALADALEVLPADADSNAVAALIRAHDETINAALLLQATNEEVEDHVRYTLMSIFGIAKADLPQDLLADLEKEDDPSQGSDEEDREPDKGNSGGAGDGEQLFGSNDTVYDPETEEYVSYGVVLNRYYAKITEMLADGASPEEIEDALNDYYAILYDGSKQEN